MQTGTVQCYAIFTGHGAIVTDEGERVFLHWRDVCDCARELHHGDRVEFLLARVGGEYKAIDVHRLGARG